MGGIWKGSSGVVGRDCGWRSEGNLMGRGV